MSGVDPGGEFGVELRIAIGERVSVVHASDSIGALLGHAAGSLSSGRVSLCGLIHPDDRDIERELFAPRPTAGEHCANLRLRHADGRIRCVKASYRKSAAADGVVLLDLLLQDVRTLPRTMDDPAASPTFNAMLENTDDYIYCKDRNHVFTGASQTLVSICSGVSHWSELLGQTDYDVFPEPYADHYYRLEKQVFAGAAVAREVQRTLGTDGREGWVDNRKYPIRDGRGAIVGLYGIARDVTEARRAEFERDEALARLRKIADRVPGMVYQFRLRPDGSHCVPYANEAIGDIFRCSPAAVREDARALFEVIHPDDVEAVSASIARSAAGLSPWRHQFRVCFPDGSVRWLFGDSLPEREADGGTLWHGFITDISSAREHDDALRESEMRFRSIMENVPSVAVQGYTLDGTVIFWNRASELLYGYGADEAIGGNLLELIIPPGMRADVIGALRQMADSGEPIPAGELQLMRRDGGLVPVFSSHAIVFPGERQPELFCIDIDLSAHKEAEAQLQLAASVFTHAREGIFITTADGTIVEVNDAFTRITGFAREEIVGQHTRALKSGRQGPEFYAELWAALISRGHWSGEIWNRRKSGEVYAEMLTITAVRDELGTTRQYVALFSDITAQKQHQQQLERIAHFDPLTALPNRVLLADRLRQAMAQAQRHGSRLAVAYLDLDGFKTINDRHGHDAGDQLLMALAARMKLALRESDTLARLGGDEFVGVFADLDDVEASVPMIMRLLAAAAEPMGIGHLVLQVSASIGVTFYPQAEEIDADQLLRQADQAMYQAKIAGKNRYHVFDADEDRSVRGHHETLERIRQAIDLREFVLHYQPKVNMRSGDVVGAEALIRWRHPERGLLPPADFLPVIENHPLAVELGEWVIDAALAQMDAWRAAGFDLPVSVNVGARQLQQPDFAARLGALLAAHTGGAPGCLELEVLETSALDDLGQIGQIIDACNSLGVRIALDDFGTGYSSLSYLKRLRADQLKIDQSFVRDMLDDPEDLAILEGVLGLATAFRREVIAEGVESLAHGEMLLELGCELAQGFGIARPMPAEQLPGWAATWRPDRCWLDAVPVGRDDLPVLFAIVEHRAWVAALERHLADGRALPPALDHRQCRFGRWLAGAGGVRYAAQVGFAAIEPLHRRAHALAEALCGERPADADARRDELRATRDALTASLLALVRPGR